MAKKKAKAERKPTPAQFMLTMTELNSRLRRAKEHRNIAVRLPKELNNLLWITNNFPFDEALQDYAFPIETPFVTANIVKRINQVRTFNSQNQHLVNMNRNVFAFQCEIKDLDLTYDTQALPSDILWWFYSENEPTERKQSLIHNFYNHMYYDDKIHPALIIDKWVGIPNFFNHYIPLSRESQDD